MTIASRAACAAALVFMSAAVPGARQAPPPLPAGISREVVHDDAKVMVARLTMKPGARETIHTHPFDAVIIQVTAGDVELQIADKKSAGPVAAGTVTFVAKDVPHAAANIGRNDITVVTVAVK